MMMIDDDDGDDDDDDDDKYADYDMENTPRPDDAE